MSIAPIFRGSMCVAPRWVAASPEWIAGSREVRHVGLPACLDVARPLGDNAGVSTDASGVESRRSARTAGRFWVAVEGVDAELLPRRGDISATGIFFETELEVGEAGTVQWLRIASWDRACAVTVMAHVVRAVTLADVHREIRGVALEFMPESDAAAASICELARYILESPQGNDANAEMSPRVSARAAKADAEATSVSVKKLSVQTLLLETDWTVPVGESVRVEIIARGVRRPIRVEGTAVSVLPALASSGKRYRIAVHVSSEVEGPLRRFSSMMPAVSPGSAANAGAEARSAPGGPLDHLLSALIQPPETPPERRHLTGLLSRIPLTTLCSLIELERLSGDLTIRRGTGTSRLFLRDGRFVDVEPYTPDPRRELAKLIGCRDGSFVLDIAPVERVDRIGATMTQLLLDLACAADEASSTRDV
jgi:hypothetical protein